VTPKSLTSGHSFSVWLYIDRILTSTIDVQAPDGLHYPQAGGIGPGLPAPVAQAQVGEV